MSENKSNVANELGHTYYPKYVTAANGDRVIVQNEQEEKEVTSGEVKEIPNADKLPDGKQPNPPNPPGWGSGSTS